MAIALWRRRWCLFLYEANRRRSITPRHFCNQSSSSSSPWKSMEGLVRCPANDVPLTPISFLERAARVYRDRSSLVYGSLKFTWEHTHHRCLKLASALTHLGISPGDVVATLAPNVPAMQELHFAVPMAGGVICTLNTRQDSAMISVLLHHSEAKVIFVDYELLDVARRAIDLLVEKNAKPPTLVVIPELNQDCAPSSGSEFSKSYNYESLLANGDDKFVIRRPESEWNPISINYTSGTTSRPKGVIYNHRGAYLNALATANIHGMCLMPTYLWTVPMFHCNGWCLIWGLAALGGTNICVRRISGDQIIEDIIQHNVTHIGGAPTVLNMIIKATTTKKPLLPHKVDIMTGGSPPPQPVISKMQELGFRVSHLYGLTETYGPGTSCVWKPEWDDLHDHEQVKLKARQGVQHFALEEVDVKDSVTMESVPSDGVCIGEIMFRGNTVMSGYLKDVKATEEAMGNGWFRSGDLGVKHTDGYIELKDRLKDIIISGGENICTVEVETVLYRHPGVFEVAVVARPDEHWGQTPCAFVKLKEGFEVDSEELISFCREHLPHYMAPKSVVFGDLPKTTTGKIQKFVLREKAKAMGSLS